MDRHQFDAEDRQQQLDRLIDTRVTATENDILAGRMAIVRAVAEKTGEQLGEMSLSCAEDEAEALVRAAVLGRSALVGVRVAEVVQFAIYSYVLPLAQADLVETERQRAEAEQHERIERRVWARFFSREVLA